MINFGSEYKKAHSFMATYAALVNQRDNTEVRYSSNHSSHIYMYEWE